MAGARQMPLDGVDPRRTQMGQALCQSPMPWRPTGPTDSTGIGYHGAKQTQFLSFWPENAGRARKRSQSEVARPLRRPACGRGDESPGLGPGARPRQTKPIWLALCPQEHRKQRLTASLRTRDTKRQSARADSVKQSQFAGGTAGRCSTSAVKQTQFRGFWPENEVDWRNTSDGDPDRALPWWDQPPRTSARAACAKQSQCVAARSPLRASACGRDDRRRRAGSIEAVAPNKANRACSVPVRASRATPHGVTTNRENTARLHEPGAPNKPNSRRMKLKYLLTKELR